jgi:hypothetical protein
MRGSFPSERDGSSLWLSSQFFVEVATFSLASLDLSKPFRGARLKVPSGSPSDASIHPSIRNSALLFIIVRPSWFHDTAAQQIAK